MAYLRIPESTIATSMSGLLGKAVGSVVSAAQSSLFTIQSDLTTAEQKHKSAVSNVNSKIALYNSEIAVGKTGHDLESEKAEIESLKKSIQKDTDDFNKQISAAEKKLSNIERQMSAVDKQVTVIKKLVKTLKVPLKALKITVTVLKALPMPQMYLVVSVTVLYSDLLEMTMELIKQAEELCSALESVCEMLPAQLDSVKQLISDLRSWIATLKISVVFDDLQEEDREALEKAGLVDTITGENLISKVAGSGGFGGGAGSSLGNGGGSSNGSDRITLAMGSCSKDCYNVNYLQESKKLQKALDSVEFQNKLRIAQTGSIIEVSDSGLGTWLNTEDVVEGLTDGVASRGSNGNDGGIGVIPDVRVGENSTNSNGMSGSVTGVRSDENSTNSNRVSGSVNITGSLTPVIQIRLLGDENTTFEDLRGKSGVISFDSSKRDQFVGRLADTLDKLKLSTELKDKISDLVQSLKREEGNSENSLTGTYNHIASDGRTYNIVLREDTKYSQLALRHYAEVLDDTGTVVLQGPVTFSLDKDILLEDAKARLEQVIQ